MNSRVSQWQAQSHLLTLYSLQRQVSSTELPHPIPVYPDTTQWYNSAADERDSERYTQITHVNEHRSPVKYCYKRWKYKLATKDLPTDKCKLFELSTKCTRPFTVLKYNAQNQIVTREFSHFLVLSNISNMLHTSSLKLFLPNDDLHFTYR